MGRPGRGPGEGDRLALIGAGPVALAAGRAALEDRAAGSIVAIVDPADEARRRAVGALGGSALRSVDELAAGVADLAVAAFSSRAELVAPVAVQAMGLGCHVVTTCEELADPLPAMRAELAGAAQRSGRSLVVTGANPGFVMDRLPLELAGGCRGVRHVHVIRRLDTRTRRRPLVVKSGYGLSVGEFEDGARAGSVGHVGLEVSARLLAEGLGWDARPVEAVIEPVLDGDGPVLGQYQRLVLADGQDRTIRFELTMAWGLADPVDRVHIEGTVGLDVEIPGGYPGDEGTTARVVHALARIGGLRPGYYRPIDLPTAVAPRPAGPGQPGSSRSRSDR